MEPLRSQDLENIINIMPDGFWVVAVFPEMSSPKGGLPGFKGYGYKRRRLT